MQIHLLAVGEKMPAWVQDGFSEYAKRLPHECRLTLKEIPPGRRGKNADVERAMQDEAERIDAALPRGVRIVALDVTGKSWSTQRFSMELGAWMQDGRDVALLIGGPDGLHSSILARAEQRWSLSPLTFPHPLVRVVVAEQVYRAWSLLNNHPYHRA